MAYSFEMVLVGMILLSAMVAGAIVLNVKRRRERREADGMESRVCGRGGEEQLDDPVHAAHDIRDVNPDASEKNTTDK